MSIYNINDPITLTEADADEFLRNMGITLYEDTIMIEGTDYEGTYGESILEANGIFLYEDGIVLEGKQAEEYKARKAKEAADAEKAEIAKKNKDKWDTGLYKGSKHPRYYDDGHWEHSNDLTDKAIEMVERKRGQYNSEFLDRLTDEYNYDKKSRNFAYKTADTSMPKQLRDAKNKRYADTAKKYAKMANDASKEQDAIRKRRNSIYGTDVHRSTMRYLKNQERINRSNKSTNESTIFSDIDII